MCTPTHTHLSSVCWRGEHTAFSWLIEADIPKLGKTVIFLVLPQEYHELATGSSNSPSRSKTTTRSLKPRDRS